MNQKILIADDDPISLHVISQYLQEAGYQFATAHDGQQAWEFLSQAPEEFTVVIADRIMPHLHGLDLLLKMQQHPVLKNIPLIMLTGAAEKTEIVAALKAGVFDFLHKSIDKDLLLMTLKRACK